MLNSLVQLWKLQSISIDSFSLPNLPPTPNSFRGIRGKTSSFRRWLVICSDDSIKYDYYITAFNDLNFFIAIFWLHMSDFCARYGKYREMVNFLRKYLGDFLIASYLDVIQESGYDAVYVKEIEVTLCSFPMVNSLMCYCSKFTVQICHYPNICIF